MHVVALVAPDAWTGANGNRTVRGFAEVGLGTATGNPGVLTESAISGGLLGFATGPWSSGTSRSVQSGGTASLAGRSPSDERSDRPGAAGR